MTEVFEFFKSKSKESFQNFVKVKAKKYELERLKKLQKSKTTNLPDTKCRYVLRTYWCTWWSAHATFAPVLDLPLLLDCISDAICHHCCPSSQGHQTADYASKAGTAFLLLLYLVKPLPSGSPLHSPLQGRPPTNNELKATTNLYQVPSCPTPALWVCDLAPRPLQQT